MLKSPSARQILVESIIFGSIGTVLFLGRLWSRALLRRSWKKLMIDDYVMVATFCCYVTLLTLINVSEHYATNEYLPFEADAILANPEEIRQRIYGSKIVVGSNQAYLLTLWGVKTCLLMLYHGLTFGTRGNLYVKIVMVYAALGFVFTEASLFIFCHPFSQYWALPVSNQQCANYEHYCIVQMVFNVSSDLLMLAIPIPLIIRAQVSVPKRALLVGTFGLGLFTVTASILDKYFNFTMLNSTVYMIWHIREVSTSVFVANIMCWWPLLRKFFGLKRFLSKDTIEAASGKTSNSSVMMVQNGIPTRDDEYLKSHTRIAEKSVDHDIYDLDDIELGDVRIFRTPKSGGLR
ncbi:uncharacterized protein PV09_08016 [Verruconis gallopava]|uniref:Rhodopsin domain-containing protein n=1 Tax=Verruconis gallopava TaxID=253628 RepID=A0A0D2A2E6_9PEZI|nr:uncharacterized protein PV09_08016 [Verruconis gallopava]KIW00495.1 hypothetical protein PV09_08016 [Verruconis gallopava]